MRYTMNGRNIFWVGLILLALAGLSDLGCQLLGAFPSNRVRPEAETNFQLIAEAWNAIQENYVDRGAVNSQKMTYGALSGMVASLGDTGHSRFLSPEMVKRQRDLIRGHLEGIGAEVQIKDNQVVIVAPIDGSPAQHAGLKPGDVILKVNGEGISGIPLEQAVGKILGPAGTSVTLTILHPDTGRTTDVTLIRAHVTIRNVKWHPLPGTKVAHLRIATFSRGVTTDLRQALGEIEQGGLNALILDLRNNPGGLFKEAVETASQFLSGGNVLLEKDARGKITPVPVRPGGRAPNLPLVVLINGGTASAPEIVAGALRDARRGTLVGEKTFGTGTVLEPIGLSDGSALLLATKEWLTPAGQLIWHKGITPDLEVPLPRDASPLFPVGEKGITVQELRQSKDEQLLRSLDLLLRPRTQQEPIRSKLLHDVFREEGKMGG